MNNGNPTDKIFFFSFLLFKSKLNLFLQYHKGLKQEMHFCQTKAPARRVEGAGFVSLTCDTIWIGADL